jgi:hypothetical protein
VTHLPEVDDLGVALGRQEANAMKITKSDAVFAVAWILAAALMLSIVLSA